ncbi:MAG TPA: hypothetical protein P5064_00245 [Clostridia bacterium]|jgi:hypothetical protein|nr:hypothetical protein [Clostridiaceae bacterium]HOM34412.1 hypothetical protein [Clostridia bacterium]HOT71152.1 hypothetical protein [Clostridia bacterium]HQG01016.1 hypothetical protein [Clostridia bacterium]HQH65104.1 hypothetical protein [Clostridia bacterium]
MKTYIKAGWRENSITPTKRASLAGQFYERISEYVETDITVTALAVSSEYDHFVICSCDLLYVQESLMDKVRQKIEGRCEGLDPMKVILNATHTHTSIDYGNPQSKYGSALDVLKKYVPEDFTYTEKVRDDSIIQPEEAEIFLADSIADAVINAWNNRKKAYFSNAFGRAPVGMCRRAVYKDGTALMWGDTQRGDFIHLEGGNDSGIELIYFYDEKEHLTGIVANIACPSQILEHRSFISSDYWGKVKILLRKQLGPDIFLLALCGAAGDQCPRDLIRWVPPITPIDDPNITRKDTVKRVADPSMFDIEGSWKAAKRIANEIIDVYSEAKEHVTVNAVIKHECIDLQLPLRKATEKEYEYALFKIKEFVKNKESTTYDFNDKAKMHVHAGTVARYMYQQKEDKCNIEMHVIRMGDIAIATNPFELFLDYGNIMKARSRASQTLIVQLACGCGNYLPTKKAEQHGHYSAYISSGITGHAGGRKLTEVTLETIDKLWEEEDK